jgi:hypothetical protein
MSSPESYRRYNAKIGRKGEDVFRNGDTAILEAELLAVDITTDDEFPISEPDRQREEHHPVGAGRNLSKLSELGFNVPNDTLPFLIQTAVQLYHALGNCVTVGTALGTPFSDTIASGQGTTVVTMTTHTAMTPDEHIGRMLVDETAGISYAILDNDASTITVHKAVASDADGNTVSITEANNLPSQAFHIEEENTVDAKSIRTDLLGTINDTIEQIFEKEADGVQNVGVLIAKAVTGSDLTQPSDKTEICLNWANASTFTLTYNSTNPVTADECDSVTLRIANNYEIRPAMGDENAKKPRPGIREYEIVLHIFPENDTLKNLRNTKVSQYLTNLTYVFKVVDANNSSHYIQYSYTKLYVSDYPKAIPGKDQAERGLDCTLRNAPGGTLAVEAKDSLNILHYER